jgi:EAL domain-containing protein (putative c-di-GMP-specific phosphodiesterase class I)
LAAGGVVSVYQPIVELASRTVVGYEALARWSDPRLSDVSRVFQEAREGGYLADLDWPCRAAAFQGALEAGLDTRHALFVNVEPISIETGDAPDAFQPILRRAEQELRVVIELTERSLLDGPANVLALVNWARDRGWRVALDDVGAHPDSLALLPFIAPDVIKLDLNLIQQTPSRDQARTITAVMAHAERTGATLLAEGIETQAHLDQALSLGATLGQGWLLGYPGPLVPSGPGTPMTVPSSPAAVAITPFDLVHGLAKTHTATRRLLAPLCRRLEVQATNLMDPPVLLSAFQTATRFTAETARRYSRLAQTCPIVGALGVGMPDLPAPGVRGGALTHDDPLTGEWTVVLLGAHYAAAFIARDIGDDGPEDDRRFEFMITHDRDTVINAGRSLMSRFIPHIPSRSGAAATRPMSTRPRTA